MRIQGRVVKVVVFVWTIAFGASHFEAVGQTVPWGSFQDPVTGTICDTVIAANAQLVVLKDTSELTIVSGSDVTLSDATMDEQGNVTFEGNPAGSISFATDGDGNARVFWMTLTGSLVNVDGFTGQPTDSHKMPDSLHGVRCDACPLWDDQSVCSTTNPPPITPPQTTVHVCGQDVPVSIGMIALLLVPLRFFGPGRRNALRHRKANESLVDLP
ncbi:MAG: hypothetical protein HY287_07125 [Planctomycetes bacterium]|nr:hypothetical protein [Planctomycetota bacterium]